VFQPDELKVEPLSKMREAIGRRLSASKREAPHFYAAIEVDMDAALALLASPSGVDESAPTLTGVVVKAAASALVDNPVLNSIWTERGPARVGRVNISVAVALDEGLITPTIADVDRLSVAETSQAIRDVADRARAKRLRAQELGGGTFTVTNLGMYQLSEFYAIINPPQVAILAAGRTQNRLKLVREDVVSTQAMVLTLSADHRVVDGVDAARFLESIKTYLEAPATLMVRTQEVK